MGSIATKFNFFIHNLAQLRFSGLPSNDEPILSFSPKTYSFRQDGRIKEVSVFTYHKKYNPDKHYVSLVWVFVVSCLNFSCPFLLPLLTLLKFQAFVLFMFLSPVDGPEINKCIWSIPNCFLYLFFGKFAPKPCGTKDILLFRDKTKRVILFCFLSPSFNLSLISKVKPAYCNKFNQYKSI